MLTSIKAQGQVSKFKAKHKHADPEVRRVTPTQAKYIRMFYGEDVLAAVSRKGLRQGS